MVKSGNTFAERYFSSVSIDVKSLEIGLIQQLDELATNLCLYGDLRNFGRQYDVLTHNSTLQWKHHKNAKVTSDFRNLFCQVVNCVGEFPILSLKPSSLCRLQTIGVINVCK